MSFIERMAVMRKLYEIVGPFYVIIMLNYSKGIVSSIWDFSASHILVYCHAVLITDYDLSAIFYIQTKRNTENHEMNEDLGFPLWV